MNTFEDLYKRVVEASTSKKNDEVLTKLNYDPYHLECVLQPDNDYQHWRSCNLACQKEGRNFIECLFEHISKDPDGKYVASITSKKCQNCLDEKVIQKLFDSKDVMKVLEAIHENKHPVYVCIAPAFLSQFDVVTDGQLRSAFKQIGFKGVVECSLFADILTLKEALEFDKTIHDEKDYVLTSCCCPMWISMIKGASLEMMRHVPKSVSPMIATGRTIKKLVPDAITVFVGPCLAKKNEAKEEDIKDAIDIVLTFKETKDIFEAGKISAESLSVDVREHSSYAGRIYAVASGVSEAVEKTLKRIRPNKEIQVKSIAGSGVIECKNLLKGIVDGTVKANFIEGMGCSGGCVGGPRALINKDIAKTKVIEYANKSLYATPIDNPYVIEMLHRLGIHSIEELLEDQEIFTRHF